MADDNKRPSSATRGGVAAVIVTGAAAITQLGLNFYGIVGAALLVLMALVTCGGAWLLYAFIAKHGADIGEARFDTSNKNDIGEDG
jgi:hypothetical protein